MYKLLSRNVGVRNIAPVILCVLKNIAHKSVTRLPKHTLTCKVILEALTVVQAQLGEELSRSCPKHRNLLPYKQMALQNLGNTMLHMILTVQDSHSLGVRHVFSGSAKNTLETFEEILDDTDCVQQALGKDAASSKIVAKIKSAMSDRHLAEKLFNELILDFRAKILSTITENWDQLSHSEQEQLTRMNNFLWTSFCCWTG